MAQNADRMFIMAQGIDFRGERNLQSQWNLSTGDKSAVSPVEVIP